MGGLEGEWVDGWMIGGCQRLSEGLFGSIDRVDIVGGDESVPAFNEAANMSSALYRPSAPTLLVPVNGQTFECVKIKDIV